MKPSDEMVPLLPYGPLLARVTTIRSQVDSQVFHWDDLTGRGFSVGPEVAEFNDPWDDGTDPVFRFVDLPSGWRVEQSRDRCHNGGAVMNRDSATVAFVEANYEIQNGLLVELLEEPVPGFLQTASVFNSRCECRTRPAKKAGGFPWSRRPATR